ncbi:MAG: hypothetical protein K6F73_03665 [Lachnospiraceae bacterium]|nr:hypothetical protein [Lachnospiraceae bacterium]
MKKQSVNNKTSEIRIRKRRFAAFALTLIVAVVPAATVFAKSAGSNDVPKDIVTIPFDGELVLGSGNQPVVVPAGGGNDDVSSSSSSGREVFIDPNAIGASYYDAAGNIVQNVSLGRQKQGLAASVLFANSTPAGWTEAFSFSMTENGANTYSLKNGTLKIHIPGPCQKAGRTYAVLALDKDGKVHLYQDTDPEENVFSAKLDLEGYAFDLIFIDAQ